MSADFRPSGDVTLNKSINQLGILVLDGSGSMEGPATGNVTIAKAVEGGLMEMFNRFNVSKKKQNFSFACIKFDNTVAVTLEPTPFDFNTLMNSNFDPREGRQIDGGTYTNLALERAKEMAEKFLQNPPEPGIPHRVLILLLSDGQSH
ncbi:MAG: VWA domain-containing protein, partial [Nitrosopumilus sp.]|nr:VWA domain-containing protein [Nitrosopumilus sp.]